MVATKTVEKLHVEGVLFELAWQAKGYLRQSVGDQLTADVNYQVVYDHVVEPSARLRQPRSDSALMRSWGEVFGMLEGRVTGHTRHWGRDQGNGNLKGGPAHGSTLME